MEKKKLYLYGGSFVLVLFIVLYFRSRTSVSTTNEPNTGDFSGLGNLSGLPQSATGSNGLDTAQSQYNAIADLTQTLDLQYQDAKRRQELALEGSQKSFQIQKEAANFNQQMELDKASFLQNLANATVTFNANTAYDSAVKALGIQKQQGLNQNEIQADLLAKQNAAELQAKKDEFEFMYGSNPVSSRGRTALLPGQSGSLSRYQIAQNQQLEAQKNITLFQLQAQQAQNQVNLQNQQAIQNANKPKSCGWNLGCIASSAVSGVVKGVTQQLPNIAINAITGQRLSSNAASTTVDPNSVAMFNLSMQNVSNN